METDFTSVMLMDFSNVRETDSFRLTHVDYFSNVTSLHEMSQPNLC